MRRAILSRTVLATVTAMMGGFIAAPRGLAQPVEWTVASGGNGHFYEYVVGLASWTDARDAAAARSHLGLPGYLATIACSAENDFVTSLRGGGDIRAWIGLTDEASEGNFQWVTGEGYSYTNWSAGEPNNTLGLEHYVELFSSGQWNDTTNLEVLNQGYVVEYSRATVVEWASAAGGNGHFYELVRGNTSWTAADAAARDSSFCELSGHLATLTGPEENAFAVTLGGGGDLRPWIGLTDAASEGDYDWVTGEPVCYVNWAPGEPNNSGGAENWVELFGDGTWNDNTEVNAFNLGYIVEYEQPPGGFRYSFRDTTPLPTVPDSSSAGNNATAGPGATLSSDIPPSPPGDGGNASLDSRVGGATTDAVLLLSNATLASTGGFTMEAWFKWNGGGMVNALIDYAGTEKIVIDLRDPVPGTVSMRFNDAFNVPIGTASPGDWHYVAVVFDSECQNPDGTITGTLKGYLDCAVPASSTPDITKDGFGDSLARGIGVGQHPLAFPADFFDGLVYEPRVTLKALQPGELLIGDTPCPPPPAGDFVRGDANNDGNVDISDGVFIFGALFLGTEQPSCPDAADTNEQGEINISSGIYLLNFLFQGGPAPPAPFPNCGSDPSPDDLGDCDYDFCP